MGGNGSAMPGNSRWLLPEGIEELLPDEARTVERMRRDLLDLCASWGYELVMPPLVEFTESLLIGLGSDLDLQTFKLTDQASGRTLGLRPDITPQVARIDAHSLRREGPARLCYAGTVLHTRARSPLASRSPIQVGAELYGDASLAADIEVVSLMLEMLRVAGVSGITLDLGHVGIFRALMSHLALPDAVAGELFEALQHKSEPSIRALLAGAGLGAAEASVLGRLATLNGGREVLAEAAAVFAGGPPGIAAALQVLTEVADAVEGRSPGVTLHFDLCELHGYHYHTGLVFAAYAPGQGEALANGGRYDDIGQVFGRARPATGFNTDLKALLRLARARKTPESLAVFVPYGLSGAAWRKSADCATLASAWWRVCPEKRAPRAATGSWCVRTMRGN